MGFRRVLFCRIFVISFILLIDSNNIKGRRAIAGLERRVGKIDKEMDVLGVAYLFHKRVRKPVAPEKIRLFHARCRRIAKCAKTRVRRKRLINALANPIISWCGAWSVPTKAFNLIDHHFRNNDPESTQKIADNFIFNGLENKFGAHYLKTLSSALYESRFRRQGKKRNA